MEGNQDAYTALKELDPEAFEPTDELLGLIEDVEGLECFGFLGVITDKVNTFSEDMEVMMADKFTSLVPHL